MFTSGPPELPGLIAASVWIAGYVVEVFCDSPTDTGRFSELTIPLVTVASRPKGDPIATTGSPTCSRLESPSFAGLSPDTLFALMTARSVTGSLPTTVAVAVEPSLKLTEMSPFCCARSTTWLFVRISPSEVRMIPEPEPPVPPGLTTVICTTDGSTAFATASGERDCTGVVSRESVVSGLELVLDPVLSEGVVVELVVVVSPCVALYAAAPPMPPAAPSSSAPTRTPAAAPCPRPPLLGGAGGSSWKPNGGSVEVRSGGVGGP